MRRREIFIELTSLLDVILIMIFVLLTQARSQTARALDAAEEDRARAEALEQRIEALEEDKAALREESEGWKRQLITQDLVLENALVVTLSVRADKTILLEAEGTAALAVEYDWDESNYARNKLRSALRELLGPEERAVFLVLQYDRSAIYRTEYDMIKDILDECKLEARQRDQALSILELDTHGS